MGTTLVIVELLIIGFEVLVWLGLLLWKPLDLGALFQNCSAQTWLDQWKELLAIAGVAAAYTLGIVFDRLLGHASILLQQRRRQHPKATSEAYHDRGPQQRFYASHILLPHSYEIFENTGRQKRLLRATFFNSFAIAVVLSIFYRSYSGFRTLLALFIVLGLISAWTWYRSHKMLELKLLELYNAKREEETLPINGGSGSA